MKCPTAQEIVYTIKEKQYFEHIEKAYDYASKLLLDLLMEEKELMPRLRYYYTNSLNFTLQYCFFLWYVHLIANIILLTCTKAFIGPMNICFETLTKSTDSLKVAHVMSSLLSVDQLITVKKPQCWISRMRSLQPSHLHLCINYPPGTTSSFCCPNQWCICVCRKT